MPFIYCQASNRGETDETTLFKAIHGPSQEVDAKLHSTLQAVAEDPKTRDLVWKMIAQSLELTLPGLFDVKALVDAANTNAQTAKDHAAKKDDWAPF